ncbi:uncharacterized protein E6C27_scaffold34G002760 [Cucumis melo var. makuwa]|uniref:Uncharacterized protein n=1 Tax=Cucumis melo var. makuwa TaxID=1194695 RepID=A0A5A7SP17_CUCMM|nr:uncharacterized protein E6C27_scaffold34G002760 [Cucumis melo var. makuwa]
MMDDNHRPITVISMLKMELKDVHHECESISKSVKMLISENQSLDNITTNGNSGNDKKGLGFFDKCSGSRKFSTVFVSTSDSKDKSVEKATFSRVNNVHHRTT